MRRPVKILKISDTHRGFSQNTAKIHETFKDELSKLDFDLILLCGDLACNLKKQFKASLSFFRSLAGERPVLLVRGNHDFQEATYNYHFGEWKVRQASLISLFSQHEEWFREFNIHHLESGHYAFRDLVFVGWDGWYLNNFKTIRDTVVAHNDAVKAQTETDKNSGHDKGKIWGLPSDPDRLPPSTKGEATFEWMRKRSIEMFEKALESAKETKMVSQDFKVVAATHFPPFIESAGDSVTNGNPDHLTRLLGVADVLCYGHSHEARDDRNSGIRLVNAGSDYDKPRYIIFEV